MADKQKDLEVSGPGAADLVAAEGGLDRPEAGRGKGTAQAAGRKEGPADDEDRRVPRPGPDSEAYPGERDQNDAATGSQTGTIGGGGADAHNPSPTRATGVDDETAGGRRDEK